ncbi:hypothetical protein pb186bvf_013503 [Paramecium bursaria]
MQTEGSQSDSEELDGQTHTLLSMFGIRKRIRDRKPSSEELFDKLKQSFKCPICLEIFKDPVYIKDCSHRYCKECIEKQIRVSNQKKCPTCRKSIGTRRELRIDENLGSMMQMVFGDIQKYLKLEDKSSLIQIEEIMKKKEPQALKIQELIKNGVAISMTVILIARNPLSEQLDRNIIRAPFDTTLLELAQLISLRLNLDEQFYKNIDIYIMDEKQKMNKTLKELNEQYWSLYRDFQIYDPKDYQNYKPDDKIIHREIHYDYSRIFEEWI